jgi:hypothetical protein
MISKEHNVLTRNSEYPRFKVGDRVELDPTGEVGTIENYRWDEKDAEFSYKIRKDWNNRCSWISPRAVEYLKRIERRCSFEF